MKHFLNLEKIGSCFSIGQENKAGKMEMCNYKQERTSDGKKNSKRDQNGQSKESN